MWSKVPADGPAELDSHLVTAELGLWASPSAVPQRRWTRGVGTAFWGDSCFWQGSGRVADHSMVCYFFQTHQLIRAM